MAADLTRDSLLCFLRSCGGSARNAELLTHFARFIREENDDARRARNRELFKRYINDVATVQKQDGGVSYVVLKKKYRGQQQKEQRLGEPSWSKSEGNGDRTRGANEVRTQKKSPKAQKTSRPATGPSSPGVLPAAGILKENNNDVGTVNLEKSIRSSSELPKGQSQTSTDRAKDTHPDKEPMLISGSQRSSGSGQSFEQSFEWKGPAEAHNGVYSARSGQFREVEDCTQNASFCPPAKPHQEVSLLNDGGPGLYDAYNEDPWPFPIALGQSQISASSPCLADIPGAVSSLQPVKQVGLSRSNDSFLTSTQSRQLAGVYIKEEEHDKVAVAAPTSPSPRLSLPLENFHLPAIEVGHFQSLSSSQSSLPFPSYTDSDWPQRCSQDNWSSDDTLNYRGIISGDDEYVREAIRRSHEAELLSQLHCPQRQVITWHHSTGHLLDEEPKASLLYSSHPGSSPEDGARLGPVARRLSHRLRSRMCRSLGSDLDQAFREDSNTSRLKRLHRIASFLSINNPNSISSSRTHSTLDGLSSAGSSHSLGQDSTFHAPRQSQVPLDPREHEWFVKAASGSWSDIYSLFREDNSLLNKRDIVSGYTVLHWIAKHGDHRVLNTLSYGVKKTSSTLNVDARSTCGYTPLHLAAIHCHKNLLRLLVHKFKASVTLRDNSGKRPWQYLEKCDDRDLLELLGAPLRIFGGGTGGQQLVEKPTVLPAAPSAATVKRHSSLAALFKHKSQLRVSATAEYFL
ncbi:ankyrin repeat domain-containing protein SOWAHB-like [Hoplias malabaricus]|uniref:ankyrin repeat domain-containing protein SOWAHB-like n=1 Tax=Hoplias malabaricus TaxID=27720 RepID=UPI003462BC63